MARSWNYLGHVGDNENIPYTITWQGEQWYWEHLGLLENERYHNHWKVKNEWYDKYFSGHLIATTESGSLSKDAERIIEKKFG
ncbi:MAG: hypothetical protein HZA08_04670 [Nitrospirae bacterium]|nr:hypothetical protein [Nitrospirota bacterium]